MYHFDVLASNKTLKTVKKYVVTHFIINLFQSYLHIIIHSTYFQS